jgi:hypothetical protein
MKKIIMIVTIASVFAACKSDTKTDLQTNKVMLTDTTGIYKNNMSSDTGSALQRGEKPSNVYRTHNTNTNESRTSSNRTSNNNNTASTNNRTTTTTTTRRKGWSSRAKGAVIGGAAGAIGGAIVSKHKGTGALIGGVAGAAGGYIIGNEIDKKHNR